MNRVLNVSLNYFRQGERFSFSDWTVLEKAWLVVSTIMITVASVLTWDTTNNIASVVALISSITGMWCVVFAAKGKLANYYFGLINVVFYATAAFMWKLYGDFMLNTFYFLPMQFYGWYKWIQQGNNKGSTVSHVLSSKSRLLWGIITVVATVAYGMVLSAMGGITPYLDSASTVFSVISMILMAKSYAEQWVLWVVVDIVTVIMWANICFNEGGMMNFGLLIMWVLWLINAVYGLYNWMKMSRGVK